jgi:CheY-like chemotaxis protein
VLFVDDDEPVRKMVAMMLARLMATATVVSSPLEALRLVREHEDHFDVLVTDLAMPEMSGDQLVVRVRELSSALPVVVVSGDALDRTIAFCLEQGAHRFLAKPFTMAGFAQAIYDACNSGSLPS